MMKSSLLATLLFALLVFQDVNGISCYSCKADLSDHSKEAKQCAKPVPGKTKKETDCKVCQTVVDSKGENAMQEYVISRSCLIEFAAVEKTECDGKPGQICDCNTELCNTVKPKLPPTTTTSTTTTSTTSTTSSTSTSSTTTPPVTPPPPPSSFKCYKCAYSTNGKEIKTNIEKTYKSSDACLAPNESSVETVDCNGDNCFEFAKNHTLSGNKTVGLIVRDCIAGVKIPDAPGKGGINNTCHEKACNNQFNADTIFKPN